MLNIEYGVTYVINVGPGLDQTCGAHNSYGPIGYFILYV